MKKNRLISILVLSLFFVLLSILVCFGVLDQFDTLFHSLILDVRNDGLTNIFKIITEFGGASLLLAMGVLSFLFLRNKRISVFVLVNLIIAFLLNETAKSIFLRTRPVGINLIDAGGYSYPSGHSMVSLAFYGFIIYLIFRNISNKKIKWISSILLSILILCIGFSRIYLGVHYFSDVLGGFLLGSIYLIIYVSFIKLEKK